MRYLVTGAAGFLGTHLSSALLNEGHNVIGLDNLSTGTKENLAKNLSNDRFQFIHQDVTMPFEFDIDGIFNLACPASPIQYQKNPVETIKTNFLGALNCLDLARRKNVKILQSSTSEVYGDPSVSPQTEEYWGHVNPIGIRSCYDEGKRSAETLFFDHYREYGTKIKVVRIFNTYGPSMAFDDGRVVSNFVVQALTGRDITIYGTGEQTRSFCYVEDLITGIIRFFDSDETIVGPINLGNPKEHTMIELAELVMSLTSSSSKVVFEKLPGDDPKQRCPDITKARKLLKWEPNIELSEGLKRTISDFKKRME
jgi:UDP-glucuronate decarboxylase